LEVALSRYRSKEEYRQSLQDCEKISIDTQRLVETLLSLARIESEQETIDQTVVDIKNLLTQSWKPYDLQKARDTHNTVRHEKARDTHKSKGHPQYCSA